MLLLLLLLFLLILLLGFVLLQALPIGLVGLLPLLLLLLLQLLLFLLILLLQVFLLLTLAVGIVGLLFLLLRVHRRLRIRTILARGRLLVVDGRLRRTIGIVLRVDGAIVAIVLHRSVPGRLTWAIVVLLLRIVSGLSRAIIVLLCVGRLA